MSTSYVLQEAGRSSTIVTIIGHLVICLFKVFSLSVLKAKVSHNDVLTDVKLTKTNPCARYVVKCLKSRPSRLCLIQSIGYGAHSCSPPCCTCVVRR